MLFFPPVIGNSLWQPLYRSSSQFLLSPSATKIDCAVPSEHCTTDCLLDAKLAGNFQEKNMLWKMSLYYKTKMFHFYYLKFKFCLDAWHGHQSFLGSPPVLLPLGGETFPFILEQPSYKLNASRQGAHSHSSVVSQHCHSLEAPADSQELKESGQGVWALCYRNWEFEPQKLVLSLRIGNLSTYPSKQYFLGKIW